MQKTEANYRYVKDVEEFCILAEEVLLKLNGIVSVDTEFLRMYSFYPILSIIQLNHLDIDCPIILDIKKLIKCKQAKHHLRRVISHLFLNDDVTMLLHAPYQDIEAIYYITTQLKMSKNINKLTENILDTQTAVQFLGYEGNVSHERMLSELINVELPEDSPDYLTWLKRPLSRHHLEYAANDVLFLRQCFEKLKQDLISQNKWGWFLAESEEISNKNRAKLKEVYDFHRIKLGREQTQEELYIAKHICEFRDGLAIKLNIPRGWVFRDSIIANICVKQPKNQEELEQIESYVSYINFLKKKNFKAVLSRLEEITAEILKITNLASSKEAFAEAIPKSEARHLIHREKQLLQMLKNHLLKIGEKYQINPSLIATKKFLRDIIYNSNIEDIVDVKQLGSFFTGWRQKVWLGEDLEILPAEEPPSNMASNS